MTPVEILAEIERVGKGVRKVTITGGEPMEQWGGALSTLFSLLREKQYAVSMETAGTEDLELVFRCHPQVNLVVDYKLPSAKAVKLPHLGAFKWLRSTDVVKLVCEYEEMDLVVSTVEIFLRGMGCKARMVFSPVWNQSADLRKIVARAALMGFAQKRIGLNLQLHKVIWSENVRDEEEMR